MPQLTPQEFVDRWSKSELKETTGSQSHFNDVCALVGQPQPIVADPKGEFLTFESSNEKTGGGKGRADVWEKDFIRLLFCLFAEDIELLPKDLFTQLVIQTRRNAAAFAGRLRELFGQIATGGWCGADKIKNFDDGLFVSQRTKTDFTPRGLGFLISKYTHKADIKVLRPHDLRHRVGYRMAAKVRLHRLAQIMGHNSLDTTLTYIQGPQQDLQLAVEAIAWQ